MISHVNVEREEVDGRQSTAAQNLEEGWQSVSTEVGLRGRRWAEGICHRVGREVGEVWR